MHNRDENKLKKNQIDKEKRGWDGKQDKHFLTAMNVGSRESCFVTIGEDTSR
jgi:hypothetical protein